MDPILVYSITLLLTVLAAVIVIFIALGRRSSPGAIPLALLMTSVVIWSISGAAEMASQIVSQKVLWGKISYIGVMSSSPLLFWFAMQYHHRSIPRWLKPFVVIFPLAGMLLAFTNDWHYLLWSSYTLLPGTNILVYGHGPLFWVVISCVYSLLAVAVFLFARSAFDPGAYYRKQTMIILASSFFPIMGNVLYITGHSPFPGMDTTPVGFALTGLFLTWDLYQYKLLDLLPIGRDAVIENLNDSVIIIDTHSRILDFNPAAVSLFKLDKKPDIGEDLEKYFPVIKPILQKSPDTGSQSGYEITFDNKVLELRKMALKDQRQLIEGYTLFISDITARKNAENALRESEERSRLIMESAPFPMLICDILTGEVVYQNKCTSSFLNNEAASQRKISLPSLFCDPGEYKRLISILNKNRQVTDYEAQIFTTRQKRIWVLTTISIISFDKDEVMLISFNDITSRKLMEEAEKQERQFNEAMIDSAAALNSTLNFDEVLDRILTNLEKVITHTYANIMLVNDNGEVKIVRAHGYDAKGLQNLFQNGNLMVAETPSLLKMAMNASPLIIPDTHNDPNWFKESGNFGTRSYLGVPILVKGKVMGYINVESILPHQYNKNHGRQLLAFADQAAVAIENSRLFEQLGQMAMVDTLTGLYNRRHFYELGEIEIERARRYSSPLSLLLLDLDHFKNINDTYGHETGDRMLQEVSNVIGSTLRKIDIPGRLGGEEFVVLLPETNQTNGWIVAERLRVAISKLQILIDDGNAIAITASFGLSSLEDSHQNLQSLITSADSAMYKAKDNGRNRVEIARQPDQENFK